MRNSEATGRPSRRAAASAEKPSGPSVTMCTTSGRWARQSRVSRFIAGNPILSWPYFGIGTPVTNTSRMPGVTAPLSAVPWLGRTRVISCPFWLRPSTTFAMVWATPLTSGG